MEAKEEKDVAIDKIIRGVDSKGKRWRIIKWDNGQWSWEKYEVVKLSDGLFDTEKDCKNDAKTHGMDGRYFDFDKKGTEI